MNRSISAKVFSLALGAAAMAGARAADVSSYGVAKGQLYSQTSAAAPVAQAAPYAFVAWVEGDVFAISSAIVQTPAFPMELPLNDAGTRFEFVLPGELQTINAVAPNGTYSFTIDSENDIISLAQLSLSSSSFPTTVPQISNYAAAQDIDADANFALNWNTQSDALSYRLVIVGDEGEVLLQEGSASGFTIPAGTLAPESTYVAKLRFRKAVDTDTSSIPGAVGTAEYFNETEFTISTSGGGGNPGGDQEPPVLFLSSPVSGATGVSLNAPVTFTFNETMQPAQSIEWSANLNANAFTYAWGDGGRKLTATYAGGLPANASITWRLNPNPNGASNFKDVAGNMLPAGIFQGSFTTGSSNTTTNDPCNDPGGQDDGRGYGFLSKMAMFDQTGNNNPVPDTETPAVFQASFKGASNQTVTAVSISGPVNRPMQGFAGFYFISEEGTSAANIDATFPAGNYTINATGAGSATVALGSVATVPVPKVNNLVELGAMNPASAFTLTFAPFTGVTANDSIFISINEVNGTGEFHAPDICRNIQLPNTATSVVIPANTFKAGTRYQGSITFSKGNGFDTNSINGVTAYATVSAVTEFGFQTGGGTQPTAPRWTSIRRNANGTITFVLTAQTGANLVIEGGDAGGSWAQAGAGVATGGTFEFTVDPRLQPRRLYRARVL